MKKHGTDGKRYVWRKLHIAAELSLSAVTDTEVILNSLKQTHRKICNVSGDYAYDTKACHEVFRRKCALVLST